MFRSLLATLVVALSVNVTLAQSTIVDKAKADLSATSTNVSKMRAEMYAAQSDAQSLEKDLKDLKVARKAADPSQQAVVDAAYNALKAAQVAQTTAPSTQNADAEKAAADAFAKAKSTYDSAVAHLAKIEKALARKYKLKTANLEAGLAKKLTKAKKDIPMLEGIVAKSERDLTEARFAVLVTQNDATLAKVASLEAKVDVISATTKATAEAVGRVEGALKENHALIKTLSEAKITDPATAKHIVELVQLAGEIIRKFPDDAAKQKAVGDELKKAVEKLPTPVSGPVYYQSNGTYTTCPPCRR